MNRYSESYSSPMTYSMSGVIMWIMIVLAVFVGGSVAYQQFYPSSNPIMAGTRSSSSYYGNGVSSVQSTY